MSSQVRTTEASVNDERGPVVRRPSMGGPSMMDSSMGSPVLSVREVVDALGVSDDLVSEMT